VNVDGLPVKPLDWLSDENVIDDGDAGKRLRKFVAPPPASVWEAVSALSAPSSTRYTFGVEGAASHKNALDEAAARQRRFASRSSLTAFGALVARCESVS
jgi:hypothetical protein